MLRLDLKKGPRWIDLGHGVRIKALPISTPLMMAARKAPEIVELVRQHGVDGDPELIGMQVARVVARMAIQEWEGVAGADGKPAKVTPENVDAVMDVWPIFEAFQTRYMATGFLLDAEKNGSAPLPSGTSAGVATIARRARKPAATARRK